MHIAKLPIDFLTWYLTKLPLRLLRLFLHVNLLLEDQLAIRLHLRMLFVPLFHDTTIIGRFMSVAFRLGRVFVGTWALIFTNMVLAPLLSLWLFAPFLFLVNRYFALFWPLVFIYYCVAVYGKPVAALTSRMSPTDWYKTTDARTGRIISLFATNPQRFFAKFAASKAGAVYLTRLNIAPQAFVTAVASKPLPVAANFQALLAEAITIALAQKARHLGLAHLLAVLVKHPPYTEIFKHLGITELIAFHHSAWLTQMENAAHPPTLFDEDYFINRLGGVNRGWQGVPTPTLNLYSTDITLLAARGKLPPIIGRAKAAEQIVQILARAERENVLLLGESGSGKTSMVYQIAQQIIAGGVPKPLFSKRVVQLDAGALVAGATLQGTLEQRLQAIVDEIRRTGNVILFLDDLHEFLSISSASGNLDVLSFLKPYLSANDFQVIAATSTEHFATHLAHNTDFVRLFQTITLPVVSKEEAIAILATEARMLEAKHHVTITFPAMLAAVDLSDRYIHDRVLPGKAYDSLDEACVATTTANRQLVTKETIEAIVEQKTGIPVHDANVREKQVLLNLEAKMHGRLIGQDDAVVAVANAMRRARVGVRDDNRPIASFLFVGPTGVGKTELAKTLAREYFGNENAMVRFDMSEYSEPQSLYRLLGNATNGQIQPGLLPEAIRQKPSTLVLFDEIEKADPSILDLFLQVLDDGRITDSLGHTVTFQDTIIIATSNAGTQEIEDRLAQGETIAKLQADLLPLLTQHFRIEFLNRFDSITLFKPLTGEDMIQITKILLAQLKATMAQKGYQVDFAPELIGSLAQRGYNPQLGARPLRRLIQDEVESQIAKLILAEQLHQGQPIIITPQIR